MAKTCYLWNNTYYRTDVIFFWAKKPFKSSCNFKYMHYANGLPVYNYNSCVHWYVEQFVSSRLGLWYKPWFYLHVQTFLKKVNLNFTTFAIQNNTDFGIATNPILVSDTPWKTTIVMAGWDCGVRADPSLQPAAQQAHVLADQDVAPLGPQLHRQVGSPHTL